MKSCVRYILVVCLMGGKIRWKNKVNQLNLDWMLFGQSRQRNLTFRQDHYLFSISFHISYHDTPSLGMCNSKYSRLLSTHLPKVVLSVGYEQMSQQYSFLDFRRATPPFSPRPTHFLHLDSKENSMANAEVSELQSWFRDDGIIIQRGRRVLTINNPSAAGVIIVNFCSSMIMGYFILKLAGNTTNFQKLTIHFHLWESILIIFTRAAHSWKLKNWSHSWKLIVNFLNSVVLHILILFPRARKLLVNFCFSIARLKSQKPSYLLCNVWYLLPDIFTFSGTRNI